MENLNTKKRILINSSYLIVGSIISKAAMLLVFILVARYFGPESYGAYSSAFSFVFLSGMFSKLGIEMTVIREGAQNLDKVSQIQNKFFPLRFWLSIAAWFISILVAFIVDFDSQTFNMIVIMSPTILIGGAITSGIYEHFTTYFKIVENMKFVTIPQIIRTFVFAASVLAIILMDFINIYVLTWFVVGSSLVGLYYQYKFAKSCYEHEINFRIDFNYLQRFIRPILLFGLVSIIYEASLRINILMLNKLGDNTQTGFYSAAWQLVSVGTLFISSFSTTIFPNSARNIFFKTFRMKALKAFMLGALGLSIISFIVPFLSPFIIELIFGDEYLISASILNIIIWFLPFRFLSLWGHQILESADYLVLRVIVFVIPTIINIILNYFLIPNYGALGAAYASLISNVILLILAFVSALFCVRHSSKFEK